ncbi:alpha-1A adrenergic receptor-like [Paramacrobiotus metropolitanus]|uniref:alpha-1A adrenergic receptor-like n=1 Tax=Paramacrobiotus metropolitanus TaxID=2943436 RepID=UPI002445B57C|nr:alpha-1A adrenergic receptor-like [Paramacrobiotus metropolitanus]
MNISTITGNLSVTMQFRHPELIALITVNASAAVIGTILSLTLFLTMILRPQLRTGSGILIAHHQLLHVLLNSVVSPFYIVTAWGVWLGGSISGLDCNALFCACQLIVCCETWSSLFLAVNRFVALTYPHQYSHISSNTAVTGFIMAAWAISMAINLLGAFGVGSIFGRRELGCGVVRVTDQHLFNVAGSFDDQSFDCRSRLVAIHALLLVQEMTTVEPAAPVSQSIASVCGHWCQPASLLNWSRGEHPLRRIAG